MVEEDDTINNKNVATERHPLVPTQQQDEVTAPKEYEHVPMELDQLSEPVHSTMPRSVQLHRLENLAVPACYLTVGLLQGLNRPLLNVYPLDLGATEAQQLTVSTLVTLPATFKMLFGFISDNFMLFGLRRKPYMLLGWTLSSISMFALASTSNLSISYSKDGSSVPPSNAPSIQWLSLTFFSFGTGMWLADVMGDSIVAEKARLEPEERKGHLQSTCYACRFFGLMVASPCSTAMYASTFGPSSIVLCMAIIPLLMLPLIYYLGEQKCVTMKSTSEHCREIWTAVCSRSVWQPIGFAYLFNLLQVSNAAWRQFLKTVLGFSAAQLNALLVASYVLLYFGTLTYKYCFLQMSWRRVYQVCILLNAIVSALQILLIQGNTFGLSPFLFALGDDAVAEFIGGIQFLPITIMMVNLCPDGSEGASYAMFTTVWNSAMMLSPSISTLLLGIWDVSEEALEAGELTGLLKLSVLTTCIQTSAIFFVGWMPHSRVDLEELSKKPYSGSKIGGFLFLSVVGCSTFYTFAIGILNIVKPGWAGGS